MHHKWRTYFKLDKGTRQCDPISAYLLILVLEIGFDLIKQNKDIHDLTFFDHTFLYTAYADDTTFFLKDKRPLKKVMNVFDTFSIYSGLKPNTLKCEIAGIGVLKRVAMELCRMECIDLTKISVKILGIPFSDNKKIEIEDNLQLENVLKIWRIKILTVQGKITIFKTLAISKVIHLALVANVPKVIIDQLNKIQKDILKFILLYVIPTKMVALKVIIFENKLTTLQRSWIKRLYDTTSHCWKIIPAFMVRKKSRKIF